MGGFSTSLSHILHPVQTIQNQQDEDDARRRLIQAQANASEQQGQIMTAQNKEALLNAGPQVRDSSIGPAVSQTTQTTPDLPASLPASMQQPASLDLPDGPTIANTTSGDTGLSGRLLAGTGSTMTADRPADFARTFSYKSPDGHTLSVELDPSYDSKLQ